MRSGSNLRSSDHFRFSAADLGGLDTHAGDRSGAVGSGDHVAGLVLELVGKHCIAVESGGFGHILAIGEPDFVLALPLPMAAMRRASLRMRPLRLRPSKLCACSCFFFLPCSFVCAVRFRRFVAIEAVSRFGFPISESRFRLYLPAMRNLSATAFAWIFRFHCSRYVPQANAHRTTEERQMNTHRHMMTATYPPHEQGEYGQ